MHETMAFLFLALKHIQALDSVFSSFCCSPLTDATYTIENHNLY